MKALRVMEKMAPPDAWTLLVVDTDGTVGERLSESLLTDCTTQQAMNLSVAVAMLAEYPFDAVILSLTLPDSPGLAALNTIRQAAPESAVIVLDSDMNQDRAAAAARQGAHDYFVKAALDPGLLATALTTSVASNRAEWSMRRSEIKFRGILETLDEAYYELDLAGRFTYVNDTLCRHLQRPREELIGRQSLDFSSPERSRIREMACSTCKWVPSLRMTSLSTILSDLPVA